GTSTPRRVRGPDGPRKRLNFSASGASPNLRREDRNSRVPLFSTLGKVEPFDANWHIRTNWSDGVPSWNLPGGDGGGEQFRRFRRKCPCSRSLLPRAYGTGFRKS